MSAMSHETKWYAVNDAKIAVLTADPAGGTATYDEWVDIPGIKTVGVSGDVNSVELRGDGQRLDQASKLGGLTLSWEGAKLSVDMLAATAGGTTTDSGTTPARKVEWELLGTDEMKYFKFEAMTTGVDTIGGDGHIVLYKCILSSFPGLGFAEEDYQTFSVEGAAMPLVSNGKVIKTTFNETKEPIDAP